MEKQLPLPLWAGSCYYECVNPHCFYCEHQMSYEDVHFKQMWCSELQDLDLVPHCPSCMEVMLFWHVDDLTDDLGDVNPRT